MKRGVFQLGANLILLIFLSSFVSAAWTLEAEDGITSDCGGFGGSCPYWISWGGDQRQCFSDPGTCVVAESGNLPSYYTMNTSGASVMPNSVCSVSVNVTNLDSTTNETLVVTINGLSQLMPDQGTSGSSIYTFPQKFNFTEGNGKDVVNFTGTGDDVEIDNFMISDCQLAGQAVPEFSSITIMGLLAAVIIGIVIFRKK